MKKQLLLLRERGFTLVELMVVVAIIGILSAIAVPNFKKYQAKSKTSEAKLQLSAAYTAEQSFYSDYDTFHACLKYMGYNPTNETASRYYAVGFGTGATIAAGCSTVAIANGAVTGAGACVPTATVGETFFSAGKQLGGTAAITSFSSTDVGGVSVSEDNFTLAAVGNIDDNFTGSATASAFAIDDNKLIRQRRAGY